MNPTATPTTQAAQINALVTQIENGIAGVIQSLYPGMAGSILIRRHTARSGRKGATSGWTEGDAVPCFIISCDTPEEVDGFGGFEHISLQFNVHVEYVDLVEPNSEKSRADDPVVRGQEQNVLQNLYVPHIPGAPSVWDVRPKPNAPFEDEGPGKNQMTISGTTFSAIGFIPRLI